MTRGGTSNNSRVLGPVPITCIAVRHWYSYILAVSWKSYNTVKNSSDFPPDCGCARRTAPCPTFRTPPPPYVATTLSTDVNPRPLPPSPRAPPPLRVSFLCESFCEWLQIAPEDLLGKPLSIIVDPRDTHTLNNAVFQVLAGGIGNVANSGRQDD